MKCRRRQWHPTPVLLPGKSHRRRSLVGCSPWGHKESDTTEWLTFKTIFNKTFQFSSAQLLSHVQLFVTPWTAAHLASLSITNSWSLLKLMSIELVMPSNHLILCHPLLLLSSIFPIIRVFSNESLTWNNCKNVLKAGFGWFIFDKRKTEFSTLGSGSQSN